MSNVTPLNNLSDADYLRLNDRNIAALHRKITCDMFEVCAADLEPWQVGAWYVFMPYEYLAWLDKNNVRICMREYSITRDWAR